MKALVTGGAGFAGSHLSEYLLSQGYEVIALVRDQENLSNLAHILPRIRVEAADICDCERIAQVLAETKPQRIYHLAAKSSPSESFQDPRPTYDVNFGGTFNLLLVWRRLELDCRLLFVSSGDVYGIVNEKDFPLRENAAVRPANPYAGSKAAAELLAVQFFQSYGLPIIRVRPFNHTGPRQSPAFVCSGLARQIAEIDLGLRQPVVTVGNSKSCRDFSDVRDIVRGYHMLLEKGEPGDVYQLCSGRAVSIETVLQSLISLTSKTIRVTVDETKLRSVDPPAVWGDPSKAKHAVGWSPQFDLQATLRDLKLYWERVLQL